MLGWNVLSNFAGKNKSHIVWHKIILFVLVFLSATAGAAGFENGEKLYSSLGCAGCHGDKSGSLLESYPSLVGANADLIRSELNKYRNGVRKDPTMSAMAAGLKDKDIKDLANYIANR